MIEIVSYVVLAAIVVTAILALKSRDLVYSVVFLAMMSLLLSLEFYILQAPDVAMAEAAIGAGLSSAIYIIAINRTGRFEDGKK